ncbi:MAG: DUF2997 domain-containing protein [Candidatus Omnitrophica bacterium]|nr:DUF2997 domain-containing protein [Candidatus Omnitrophota bacterium]
MAGKQEVEIFISDDGELKVHIRGIKGPSCVDVLEKLAGDGEIKEKVLSSEYYETVKEAPKTRIKKQ